MKLRSWSKTLLLYANWFWSDLFPDGSEASLNDGRFRSSFCKFSQRNASGVTASTMTWWILICRPPFWKWNGGNTSVILVRMSSGFCALSSFVWSFARSFNRLFVRSTSIHLSIYAFVYAYIYALSFSSTLAVKAWVWRYELEIRGIKKISWDLFN